VNLPAYPSVLRKFNSCFSVKPLSVRLVEKPKVLIADTQYNITCEAIGSRPQAKISWYRDKEDFRRGKVSTGEGTEICFYWVCRHTVFFSRQTTLYFSRKMSSFSAEMC
jgi:hypothetical protein